MARKGFGTSWLRRVVFIFQACDPWSGGTLLLVASLSGFVFGFTFFDQCGQLFCAD